MSQSAEELKEREEMQREMQARNKARRAVEKEQRKAIQEMDVSRGVKDFFRKSADRFFYCTNSSSEEESVEVKNDDFGCQVACGQNNYTCDSCDYEIHTFQDFADFDLGANLKCFELDQPLFEEKITHATLLMPVLRGVIGTDFGSNEEPVQLRAPMENKNGITRRDFYQAMQTILKTRLDDPQVNECIQILQPLLTWCTENDIRMKELEEGQDRAEIAQFEDSEGRPLERIVDISSNGRHFPEVIHAFELHGEVFVEIQHGT